MLHPLSDLSQIRTICFVSHLKQFFSYVKQEKLRVFNGKVDYFAIREQIIETLQKDVRPAYFIECLNDLVYIFAPSGKHPTSLFLSVLCRVAELNPTFAHDHEARRLAVNLFNKLILSGPFTVNENVVINLARIFEYKMEELKEYIHEETLGSSKFKALKAFILKLIRLRHFCTAGSLIKRLSCAWEEFLEPVVDAKKHQIAEEWATSDHAENNMISLLISCYSRREEWKTLWKMEKEYDLQSEFSDVLYKYKESNMTKLVVKL